MSRATLDAIVFAQLRELAESRRALDARRVEVELPTVLVMEGAEHRHVLDRHADAERQILNLALGLFPARKKRSR